MRLLLTRPQPDAERTAAALRARSHDVIVAPLLRIEAVSAVAIGAGPWAAILVTSANVAVALAAHELRQTFHDVPVLTVGERSAQAMRAAGFSDVTAAGGDVCELARIAGQRLTPGAAFLYLAGEQRSGDLPGDLRRQGFDVTTVIVYRAVAETALPQVVAKALADGIDGVLHFSRRSAEAYVSAARAAGMLAAALEPAHFCLSPQVAEPLRGANAAKVHVAPQPTEAAMIERVCTESR